MQKRTTRSSTSRSLLVLMVLVQASSAERVIQQRVASIKIHRTRTDLASNNCQRDWSGFIERPTNKLLGFFRKATPGLRSAHVSPFTCAQSGLVIDGLGDPQACCKDIGRDQIRECKVSNSDYGAMSLYKFSTHVPPEYLTCGLKGLVEAQLSRKWGGRAQKVSRYTRTALSLCALTLMFAAPPAGLVVGTLTAFMMIVENSLLAISAQRHKADEIVEVGRYFIDPLLRKYYANASFATTFPVHSPGKLWDFSWRFEVGDKDKARRAWFHIVQSFACGKWSAYGDPLLVLVGLLKLLGVVADPGLRPPEAGEDPEDIRDREATENVTRGFGAALQEIEEQVTRTDGEALKEMSLIPGYRQDLITEARELSKAEINSLDEDRCHLACQEIRKEDPKSNYCLAACEGGHLDDDAVAEFAQIEIDLRAKVLDLGLPLRVVDTISVTQRVRRDFHYRFYLGNLPLALALMR